MAVYITGDMPKLYASLNPPSLKPAFFITSLLPKNFDLMSLAMTQVTRSVN